MAGQMYAKQSGGRLDNLSWCIEVLNHVLIIYITENERWKFDIYSWTNGND